MIDVDLSNMGKDIKTKLEKKAGISSNSQRLGYFAEFKDDMPLCLCDEDY